MRGALAVDMSAPRLAFLGAVRSYLRGGTVSSCQRRLDGVFLWFCVICVLRGLAAAVCKAPRAAAARGGGFARWAPDQSLAGVRGLMRQARRARSSLVQNQSPRSV